MSKSIRTASKSSRRESKTASCRKRPSSAMSEHSSVKGTPKRIREWLTSSQPAFHANRSALPESDSGQTTNEICGPKRLNAFAWYDPSTHCWRTFQACLLVDILEPYSAIWPRAGMTLDGVFYRQPSWEHRIGGIESGLWPTPTASEARERFNTSIGGTPRPGLGAMARFNLWPTPTKTNSSYTSQESKAKYQAGPTLAEAVRMWPTPRAKESGAWQWNGSRNKKLLTLLGKARMFPMPTRTDATKWNNKTVQQRKETHSSVRLPNGVTERNGGQLNPNWVEWLMGWPIGWTDLKPLETAKFRQWLEQHGLCSQESNF